MLLCSLLLGFGLNAFVCVGTKAKGAAHTWVMTISPEGEVTFWESLTAHRYGDVTCAVHVRVYIDRCYARLLSGNSASKVKVNAGCHFVTGVPHSVYCFV